MNEIMHIKKKTFYKRKENCFYATNALFLEQCIFGNKVGISSVDTASSFLATLVLNLALYSVHCNVQCV